MKQNTITLCGKEVTLAYCYATEIAYNDLAGEDINDFMQEAAKSLQADRMPNPKKTIFLVLASTMAASQFNGTEAPIKDTDLMNDCTPQELGTALGTVLALRGEFYRMPANEPEDKPKAEEKRKGKRKNA